MPHQARTGHALPPGGCTGLGSSLTRRTGFRLLGDDQVAGLLKVDNDKRILMITENGQGKQVTFDSFTVHGRGTQGQKIYRLGGKANFIVGVLSVDDEDDVVCVTLMGQTLREHVNAISSRAGMLQVSRLVKMKFMVIPLLPLPPPSGMWKRS